MLTKRLSAVVLMACLLVALAFGGIMAWAQDSEQGGDNSLTVKATSSLDEAFVADIATANVQVDVYQVAVAAKDSTYDTYNYTLRTPYAGLEDLMKASLDSDKGTSVEAWQDFADAAFELIDNDTPVVTNVPVDEKITNMADGLFVVVAHGEGIPAKSLYADSAAYRYSFIPGLTALPSKAPDENGLIRTDDSYGSWQPDITIALKPERELRYGTLLINKEILSIAGTMSNFKKTSFHYHVVSTADSPFKYDNWASVTVDGEGKFQAPPLRHIKASTIVVVTEIYEGADFKAVGNTVSDPVTIVADNDDGTWPENVAQVYFQNTSEKKIIEGSGIQNEFTWKNNDWQPVVTPSDSGTVEG